MIGSRLLFSGYRSSYKQRPLDAGLLGQDSLLVLDEMHLSKPFEKLVKSISAIPEQSRGRTMQVIRMSATSTESNETSSEKVFRLDTHDLKQDTDPTTGKERNQIVTRFNAKKRLTIKPLGEKDDLNKKLAEAAIELAPAPITSASGLLSLSASPKMRGKLLMRSASTKQRK